MTQTNKLFLGILVVVILAIVGIVLFLKLSGPTPVAPNINQQKNTNQNTNLAQSFISAELDKEFQLKINQTALIKYENLKIKFLKVTEETRCPSDVVCKTGGRVTALVNIINNDKNLSDFSLSIGELVGNANLVYFDGYSIKLVDVKPYPKSGEKIEPSDYVVTLIISRVTASSSYEIKLKSRTFTPPEDVEQFLTYIKSKVAQPEELLSGKYHGVIQFYEIPTDAQKSTLTSMGIVLHDYLPDKAYTASIDLKLTSSQIKALGLVRALFILGRNEKLSPEIISGQIGDWARQESGKVDVIVKYYPDVPNDKAQSALQTFGGQIILSSDSFQRITIRIDENKINSLADFEWVSWIEPIAPPPTTY